MKMNAESSSEEHSMPSLVSDDERDMYDDTTESYEEQVSDEEEEPLVLRGTVTPVPPTQAQRERDMTLLLNLIASMTPEEYEVFRRIMVTRRMLLDRMTSTSA